MSKVSIVIPIYNGEKYLDRCINSVLNQSICDIEVILVDDGSQDLSGEICDEYSTRDARIKVIHKKNGGLGAARNTGIEVAEGEYIGFVDCDDWISPDMYEVLYNTAVEQRAEIVSGRFAIVHDEHEVVGTLDGTVCLYEGEDKRRVYLESGIQDRSSQYSACTKIYKKSLFDNLKFPQEQLYEDSFTNLLFIEKANRFVIINKYTYYYYMGSTSITRKRCSKKDLDLELVGRQFREHTRDTECEQLGIVLYGRTYFSLMVKCICYGMDDSFEDKEKAYKYLSENFNLYFINLMKSSMPKSRKFIMVILRCAPRLTKKVFDLFRKVRR